MEFEFDLAKSDENARRRDLPFHRVADFDFDSALIASDTRQDYGEARFIAVGYLDARLHVLAFTVRGDVVRVISFRKANTREAARYAKA